MPEGEIVPPAPALAVIVKLFGAKLAFTAASPEFSVAVVLSWAAFAMEAVPVSTVQPVKRYPAFIVAVIVVAAPWLTVTGDEAGTVMVPPVDAVTVNW